ncbi:hypothetical protein TNCV_1195121 [Trichonephila clavipes]|nr:hypothetical protein TNCV_1195121 [Trichonephila clavipes]
MPKQQPENIFPLDPFLDAVYSAKELCLPNIMSICLQISRVEVVGQFVYLSYGFLIYDKMIVVQTGFCPIETNGGWDQACGYRVKIRVACVSDPQKSDDELDLL